MNREPDFDHLVATWLDNGAEQAPERFVWAALEDIERTPQRGAWQASTEDFLMHFKRAVPVLGIAAAVVLAIVAYQTFGSPSVGDPPAARLFTAEDLPDIVLSKANAPDTMTIDYENRTTGRAALVVPLRAGGPTADTTHFVDALSVELGTSTGGFTTWAAVFETAEDAQEAFDFIAAEHDSAEGWGLADVREDPGYGDESASWTGQQYDMQSAQTIFWREGNVLLAAVGWADWTPEEVRSIATEMAERAK